LPEIGGSQRVLGERLLEHIDLSRRLICIASAGTDAPAVGRLLEDVEGWLGSEVVLLKPEEMAGLDWPGAGFVVLTGGPPSLWVASLHGAARGSEGRVDADEGCLIYAAGEAAEAMGSWVLAPDGARSPGAAVFPGAVILPGRADPATVPGVTDLLASEDHSYAVGLGQGAVLALGPSSQVEVWGDVPPTVTLGRGWR
jgi:hypothetical protein